MNSVFATLAVSGSMLCPTQAPLEMEFAPRSSRSYVWAAGAAAYPGSDLTQEFLERERSRSILLALIRRLADSGYAWSAERTASISRETAESADCLVRQLPAPFDVPRVAPDGEGGLILLWERDGNATRLLTVDGWTLHLVCAPGSAQARYFDAVPFSSQEVPAQIVAELR